MKEGLNRYAEKSIRRLRTILASFSKAAFEVVAVFLPVSSCRAKQPLDVLSVRRVVFDALCLLCDVISRERHA